LVGILNDAPSKFQVEIISAKYFALSLSEVQLCLADLYNLPFTCLKRTVTCMQMIDIRSNPKILEKSRKNIIQKPK